MLDIASRLAMHASRFPPIPFLDPPPRRIRESERRLILAALAVRPPLLPTDCPDLTPLLDALDALAPGPDGEESAA
jgi:hypothetical protein